jgi:hypothetical protein
MLIITVLDLMAFAITPYFSKLDRPEGFSQALRFFRMTFGTLAVKLCQKTGFGN